MTCPRLGRRAVTFTDISSRGTPASGSVQYSPPGSGGRSGSPLSPFCSPLPLRSSAWVGVASEAVGDMGLR
eukprot:7421477-Alexandrium_andersonii.AAC.1